MLNLISKLGAAPIATKFAELFCDSNVLLFGFTTRDKEMIDLISRRLITKHIGHKTMTTINLALGKNFIKQLSAAPHKRTLKPHFFRAWSLTYQSNATPAFALHG